MYDEINGGKHDFCSALYQDILRDNDRSVCDLKLKRNWVMLQDNDSNHKSKSTSEWLKRKKKAFEWSTQNSDLNPIEMLWQDLEQASKVFQCG